MQESTMDVRLPERSPWGHKGEYGLAFLIGGCRGMSGAIALAGKAALCSGAGLVRLGVPSSSLDTVASFTPELMTLPLAADRKGRISLDAFGAITNAVRSATTVALGPGLSRSLGLDALVEKLYRTVDKPLVIDADALNALADRRFDRFERPAFPRILTPHPGEFRRLIHGEVFPETTPDAMRRRIKQAVAFAENTGVILLLKGHETIISDGRRYAINRCGNPGMGTGGSGDVLTGIITGLLSQGLPPFEAAVLGAKLHGTAGDLAARLGEESLVAGALIEFLPHAIKEAKVSTTT